MAGLEPLGSLSGRKRKPAITPEEQQTLLEFLGQAGTSALGTAADILDTPGSVVRGILHGDNPLPGIFDTSKRTSVEDITGTDDFTTNLITGIGLDPLTYLTFGGAAVSKAGAALKKAGLSERFLKPTYDTAGKLLEGSRVKGLTKRLSDIVPHLNPEELGNLQHAAGGSFGPTREFAELLDQPLKGTVGVGLPFSEPMAVLGTGKTSQKLAGALDTAGDAIRYSAPIRHAAGLLGASNMGATSKTGQLAAHELWPALKAGSAEQRGILAPHLQVLSESKLLDLPENGSVIRRALEDRSGNFDSHLLPYAQQIDVAKAKQGLAGIKQQYLDIRQSELLAGMDSPALDDAYAAYAARQAATWEKGGVGKGRVYKTEHPFQLGRDKDLTDIPGGTDALNKMSIDPQISGSKRTITNDQLAANYIKANYFQDAVPPGINAADPLNIPSGIPFGPVNIDLDKKALKLAEKLKLLDPRHVELKEGLYPNHPLYDAVRRVEFGGKAIAANQKLQEMLAEQAIDITNNLPAVDTVPLLDLIKQPQFKFDQAQVVQNLANKLTAGNPGLLNTFHIPKSVANDANRIMQAFNSPEAIEYWINGIDRFTNFFKSAATTRISFHSRNFTSGQFWNWVKGAWSPSSLYEADGILRRGSNEISGILHWPEYKNSGLTAKEATTKEMANAFAHKLVSPGISRMDEGIGIGKTAMDVKAQFPGGRQFGFGETALEAIPKSLHEANPLEQRGVWGDQDVFAPTRASHRTSNYVEGLNRLAPYIELRKQGYTAEAAAKTVVALQTSPENLSQFDKAVGRRLVPFLSWIKGMTPEVVKELLEKPGGKAGAFLRGAAQVRGHSGLMPEYLSQGLAVPVGDEHEGKQKFLTQLDTPIESVLGLARPSSTLSGSIGGTIQELAGHLNPLIKLPAELAFQKQLFTGRDLNDLESNIGRIYSNATGEPTPRVPYIYDELLMNLPGASQASMVRTALDPRKDALTKGINLATGARISDVDLDKAQKAEARKILEEQLKEAPPVRQFEHLYVKPEDEALLTAEEKQQLELYKILGSMSQQEARLKKKQAKKK